MYATRAHASSTHVCVHSDGSRSGSARPVPWSTAPRAHHPLSAAVSASQCPTARRTVCTQKRSAPSFDSRAPALASRSVHPSLSHSGVLSAPQTSSTLCILVAIRILSPPLPFLVSLVNRGVLYCSCCHLIAGRFSRVRYRLATESTECRDTVE